jgi:hypothetical protein
MRSAFFWAPLVALALGVIVLPSPPPARADDKEDEDQLVDKVRKAIDNGVTYLKGQQREGNWELGLGGFTYKGGSTALVMLALMTAGVKPTDPSIRKGLVYLRGISPSQTYVVGLQTMVFIQAAQKVDAERIGRNVKWLLDARHEDGWSYTKPAARGSRGADNSNSQYALLALHEAIGARQKVDAKALKAVRDFYIKTQIGGGWGYKPAIRPSMAMTTAGLCNLIITGLDLSTGKAKLRTDGSAVNCGEYKENKPVMAAINWIGDRFPAELTQRNAGDFSPSPFYTLYGIERAGRLTGQRYFGGHDWYEVGCRYLVSAQKRDGSWEGNRGRFQLDSWPAVATSFALLFLSKGRTPVLISKLAYHGKDYTGWNNKRSDVKHLVEFASKAVFKGKQPLAWQVFDVRNKEADNLLARRKLAAELLQSPIVFFNGHDFAPSGKEMDILKEYLANGGFVLAENCCGKARHPKFDEEFRALMKKIYPDTPLKLLPKEHPVWLASGKFAVSPREFPLWGINQGCKTVVMYSPTPLAGYWEANLKDKGQGKKAFELGANIIAYATGLEPPRPRGTKVQILADDPPAKLKRNYLKVAQLRHEGDWQPAPKAMRNLMAEARKVGLDVALSPAEIYPTREQVLRHYFLYMHGRSAFSEKKEDLKHLRFRLKHDGLLLADACCGSKVFDKSFRKFMRELWADEKLKLQPIPRTDELFSKALNGTAIRKVRRREPGADGKREFKEVWPALEGIKYKGKWVVIYSRYDIGCALEKHSSPDCLGHDYKSAVRLALAAVLYALK